jgi:hypothetical protein
VSTDVKQSIREFSEDLKLEEDKIKSILTSQVTLDSRFKAIDQTTYKMPTGTSYSFLRIRQSSIYLGSSPQFSKIYILTSLEGEMNLIVLIPQKKGQITLDTMHENVKNGLKALQEHKRYESNE